MIAMKKIITIIMVALSFASQPLWAQLYHFDDIEGDPVEYSRIIVPRDPGSYPVILTMNIVPSSVNSMSDMKQEFLDILQNSDKDQLNFSGELIRTKELSKRDVEDAIQYAFGRNGIRDRNHLARLYAQLRVAVPKEYLEEFWSQLQGTAGSGALTDMSMFIDAPESGLSIVDKGGLALTGAKYVHKIINVASGKTTASQSFSAGELIVDGLSTAGTFVQPLGELMGPIGIVITVTDAMYSDLHYAKEIAPKIAAAKYAAQIINKFYKDASEYLRRIERETAWFLYAKGDASNAFSFRNEQCSQTWKVETKLDKLYDQEDTRDNYLNIWRTSIEGKYFGWIECDVVMDMSNYDAHFIPKDATISPDATVETIVNKNRGAFGSGNPFRENGIFWKKYADAWAKEGASFEFKSNTATRASLHYSVPVLLKVERRETYGTSANVAFQVLDGNTSVDGVDCPAPDYSKYTITLDQEWKLTLGGLLIESAYEKVKDGEHIEVLGDGTVSREPAVQVALPYCSNGFIDIDFQHSLANGDVNVIDHKSYR